VTKGDKYRKIAVTYHQRHVLDVWYLYEEEEGEVRRKKRGREEEEEKEAEAAEEGEVRAAVEGKESINIPGVDRCLCNGGLMILMPR